MRQRLVTEPLTPTLNPELRKVASSPHATPRVHFRELHPTRRSSFARQGQTAISTSETYDTDWDSEAYLTVSGQNSNNSVRLTNDFLQSRSERTARGR